MRKKQTTETPCGYYNASDIHRYLGIAESTLRSWVKSGAVTPMEKPSVLYRLEEVMIQWRAMRKKGKTETIQEFLSRMPEIKY